MKMVKMVDIVNLYLDLCKQHLESLAVIQSKLLAGEEVSDKAMEYSRELTRMILEFDFWGSENTENIKPEHIRE